MVGSIGPRMLRATMPHVDAWNAWYSWFGNRATGLGPLRDLVDVACAEVGRPAGEVARTAALLVLMPGGGGRVQTDPADAPAPAVMGAGALAEELTAMAGEGIGHVQLVLDPITRSSIEALEPVLRELEGR